MAFKKIEWQSNTIRESEWALANEKLSTQGIMLPDGSKLRREDSGLEHSFVVVGGKILAMSGKGVYLGSGGVGVVKIAEDQQGKMYALKIVVEEKRNEFSPREGRIAFELGVALPETSRMSKTTLKYYIAYEYLGISLRSYLNDNPLTEDKSYELGIKITLALHAFHVGKKSKLSGTRYTHQDVHFKNFTIDDLGNVHVIDFGSSSSFHRNGVLSYLLQYRETISFSQKQEDDLKRLKRHLSLSSNTNVFSQEMLANNQKLLHLFSTSNSIHSALELATKLTFLRFRLDELPLYNQIDSNPEVEALILQLNNRAEQIHGIYSIFDRLKSELGKLDPSAFYSLMMERIIYLEEIFKHILVAYGQKNEESLNILADKFTSANQILRNNVLVSDKTSSLVGLIENFRCIESFLPPTNQNISYGMTSDSSF